MANVDDLLALGTCVRLYTRSGAGLTRTGGDGTDATGWTDDSSESVDAINVSGTNRPSVTDDPGGGNLGPVARHQSELGFDFGLDLTGETDWTFACVLNADSMTSFRNIFSADSPAEGALYGNGGNITYEEGSTEASGYTFPDDGTIVTVIFVANATNYRLYINGSLQHTFTSIGAPGDQPSSFNTSAYSGSTAAWDGDWWATVVYTEDLSSSASELHDLLMIEVEGEEAPDNNAIFFSMNF